MGEGSPEVISESIRLGVHVRVHKGTLRASIALCQLDFDLAEETLELGQHLDQRVRRILTGQSQLVGAVCADNQGRLCPMRRPI